MIYLQLFYTFFKIGLFGFGGGYAMLSMIQGEVVTRYGWVMMILLMLTQEQACLMMVMELRMRLHIIEQ